MPSNQQLDSIIFGGAQPLSARPVLTYSGTSLIVQLGDGSSGGSFSVPQTIGYRVNVTTTVAATLFTVTLPTLTGAGGIIDYSVFSTDAVDVQARTATATWNCVNKGGSFTSDTDIQSSTSISASTGTLTATFAGSAGSNLVNFQITATTSLTPTALYVVYAIRNLSVQAITLVGSAAQ